MKTEKSFDNLKILTKDQIIGFLKNKYFLHAPEIKDVKFFLYMQRSEENIKKQDALTKKWSNSTAAKDHDKYAKRFTLPTKISND